MVLITVMLLVMQMVSSNNDQNSGAIKLAYWLSPAFPVGSFAYSHGLEQAIVDEKITTAKSLFDWLCVLLEYGSAFNDAIFLRCALRAYEDADALEKLTDLSLALASSAERSQEQIEMGGAFVRSAALTDSLPQGINPDRCAYFVALGAFCGQRQVDTQTALQMAQQAFASNLVSVAQRLVPLGQSDAVKIMAQLEPVITRTAARVILLGLDDLGSAALMSDFAAMKHETLNVRIFRT